MYKIAVLGDRDSVLGFKALGLDIFPTEGTEEARQTLHKLAKEDYGYQPVQNFRYACCDIDSRQGWKPWPWRAGAPNGHRAGRRRGYRVAGVFFSLVGKEPKVPLRGAGPLKNPS